MSAYVISYCQGHSAPPCPASLAPGDGHLACFRCLGSEHAVAALVAPASCAACRTLPEEGLLSRHLFFSPSVDLAEAIDIFRAGVPDAQDADDERFEVDVVASLDDVFPGSASEFFRSGASTEATVVLRERPRRMADLFGRDHGEAYGPEEAARWLTVSRFSSTILQLWQPIAVSAGRHMA
ncbi:unnamed protein product [Boreogadus saida]